MIPKTFLWNALINGKGKDVQQNLEWLDPGDWEKTYVENGGLKKFIKHISMPSGLIWLGQGTFSGSKIVSVGIPKTVTRIFTACFNACNNLTDIYYEGTEEEWNAITIDESNSALETATIHFNCTI